MSLKTNLVQHFDFEAVSNEIWEYLKAWYGCDFPLFRFIKKEKVSNKLFLELYPEKSIEENLFAINMLPPSSRRGNLQTSFDDEN